MLHGLTLKITADNWGKSDIGKQLLDPIQLEAPVVHAALANYELLQSHLMMSHRGKHRVVATTNGSYAFKHPFDNVHVLSCNFVILML